jgi:hypothetical protein
MAFYKQEDSSIILCPSAYTIDLYCSYINDQHGWNEFPHGYCVAHFLS